MVAFIEFYCLWFVVDTFKCLHRYLLNDMHTCTEKICDIKGKHTQYVKVRKKRTYMKEKKLMFLCDTFISYIDLNSC